MAGLRKPVGPSPPHGYTRVVLPDGRAADVRDSLVGRLQDSLSGVQIVDTGAKTGMSALESGAVSLANEATMGAGGTVSGIAEMIGDQEVERLEKKRTEIRRRKARMGSLPDPIIDSELSAVDGLLRDAKVAASKRGKSEWESFLRQSEVEHPYASFGGKAAAYMPMPALAGKAAVKGLKGLREARVGRKALGKFEDVAKGRQGLKRAEIEELESGLRGGETAEQMSKVRTRRAQLEREMASETPELQVHRALGDPGAPSPIDVRGKTEVGSKSRELAGSAAYGATQGLARMVPLVPDAIARAAGHHGGRTVARKVSGRSIDSAPHTFTEAQQALRQLQRLQDKPSRSMTPEQIARVMHFLGMTQSQGNEDERLP